MPLPRLVVPLLVATLVPSAAVGQLERSETNPRYYELGGRPRVLLGGARTLLIGEPERVDELVANGGNYARLWHHVPGAGAPLPWSRLPDGRYDLASWNDDYWTGLRDLLRHARSRGVVVSVPLWSEPGLEAAPADRWPGHPFHPANNVNDLGLPSADGVPEFFDVRNAPLLVLQDRYVDRLLDELCRFDNVVVEITNEYTGPRDWEERWIARAEARCPKAPIAVNRLPRPAAGAWSDPRIDQVNYHNLRAEDVFETLVAAYDRGKVQHYDEQALGPQSDRDIRRMAWGALLGGGGINWDQSGNPDATPSTSRALARFLGESRLDALRARPDPRLVAPGFAMSRPGLEAAGYLPRGGRATIDLRGWPGSYVLRWFDPAASLFEGEVSLPGEARTEVRAPRGEDAAFHLVRSGGIPSALWGDLNRDGAVTPRDALLALVGIDGGDTAGADLAAGDVDGDGRVTTADARAILGFAVGLPGESRAGTSR